MSDKNLDELVDLYLEDDLEEISTTAGVPGYQTPMAFTGGLPKYEKRKRSPFIMAQNINLQNLWEKIWNTQK